MPRYPSEIRKWIDHAENGERPYGQCLYHGYRILTQIEDASGNVSKEVGRSGRFHMTIVPTTRFARGGVPIRIVTSSLDKRIQWAVSDRRVEGDRVIFSENVDGVREWTVAFETLSEGLDTVESRVEGGSRPVQSQFNVRFRHGTGGSSDSSTLLVGGGLLSSKYRLLRILGEGAMSIVYEALDTDLNGQVAIKVLKHAHTISTDCWNRFVREGEIGKTVCHPHLIRVFDIMSKPFPYLVMEYVPGKTLKTYLAGQGKLPVNEALQKALDILNALGELHAHGIIHRDLKPANMIVLPEGEVKVGDFGLAKVRDMLGLTIPGTILGTLNYMPPEQKRGEEVDETADVFAFGIILHEMLTGRIPRCGSKRGKNSFLVEDNCIPLMLQSVIRRCIEYNRAKRFRSVGDIIQQVRQVQ